MSQRTAFLSKLLGLFCIVLSLAMFANKDATVETVGALLQSPPLTFLVGLIALSVGLAMVLGHNVWSGGALPVIVTLIGWATLLKALPLLFLGPDAAAAIFLNGLGYAHVLYWYAASALLLGGYLTYGGFRIAD